MNLGIGTFLRDGLTLAGLEAALRRLVAAVSAGWSVQHSTDGTHTNITAHSLVVEANVPLDNVDQGSAEVSTGHGTFGGNVTATGTGPHTFKGDVVAHLGTGTEVAIGVLTTVNGTALLTGLPARQGVLIGGVADGYFLVKRVKASAFGGSGTYALAVYDLAASTSVPMLHIAKDNGSYALIDGGTGSTRVRFGNTLRPLLEVHTDLIYEAGRAAALGYWTSVAYAAGNFTASAGSWTVDAGDQVTYAYTLVGKTMTVVYNIGTTSVTNAGVTLRLAIPASQVAARTVAVPSGAASDAGAARVMSLVQVDAAGTVISLFATLGAGGFAITAANNTLVFGSITFEVQ